VASTQTITAFSFVPVPVLTVARNGAGVVLTWPTGVGGYVLQHNSGLTSAGWSTINGPYNIVGSNFQVTITPATGTQFYRLNVSLP
jgi:hypothetical protein